MNHLKLEKYFFGIVALALGLTMGGVSGAIVLNDSARYSGAQVVLALEAGGWVETDYVATSTALKPTVIYPNGGESLVLGKDYAIRWDVVSRGENVVYIINDSGEKCLLGKATSNTGVLGNLVTNFSGNACVTGITTRKPGQYQNVSRNYKIQVEVSDVVNGKRSDESDGYFGLADINNPNSTSSVAWAQGNITSPIISNSLVNSAVTLSLKAEPTEGNIPFSTEITATRGGNMYNTGNLFRFKCRDTDEYSAVQVYNVYTCRYTTVGVHRPSVEVRVISLASSTTPINERAVLAEKVASLSINAKGSLPQAPEVTTIYRACSDTGKSRIAWKPVVGATGYVVYRSTGPLDELTKIATLARTATEFIDTDPNLVHGTLYWYKVTTLGNNLESNQPSAALLRHENCNNPTPSQAVNNTIKNTEGNKSIFVQNPNGGQVYKAGDKINFSVKATNISGSGVTVSLSNNRVTIPSSVKVTKEVSSDEQTITGTLDITNKDLYEADYYLIACQSNANGQTTNLCDISDRPIRIWRDLSRNDLDRISIKMSDETRVPWNMQLNASTASTCGAQVRLTWAPVQNAVRYYIGNIIGIREPLIHSGTNVVLRTPVAGAPYIFFVTAVDSTGRGIGRSGFVRVNSSSACASTQSNQTQTQFSRFDLNKDGTVDNRDVMILTSTISSSRYNVNHDFNSDKVVDFKDLAVIRSNIADNSVLYDLERSGKVDHRDIIYVASKISARVYTPYADINADRRVDAKDLKLIREHVKNSGNLVAFFDVNADGRVTSGDVEYVKSKVGSGKVYDPMADLNHDEVVNQTDVDLIDAYYQQNRNTSAKAIIPSMVSSVLSGAEFLISQIKIGLGF